MARTPAKLRMEARRSTLGTDLRPSWATCSNAAAVVEVSSPSTSSASGPTIRFPWTVGETRIPLPSLVGHWKITQLTRLPSDLSRR